MADIKKLSPIIAKFEGGFVNDKTDKGGATNMGVTIGTWRQLGHDKDGDGDIDVIDIRLLNSNDFALVLKRYWDKWSADGIKNQSVANLLVDWYWCSGTPGIKKPQVILGLIADGQVGPKTLAAVNAANQKDLFDKVYKSREKFLNDIVKNNPAQKKFIKGWLNRLVSFKFSE